ncbi:MAG: hypothetical protein QOG78_1548, partial [Rhodospirillaceae bacterium]|nr:hypothetical protein [Rhodospirillaceae bacterium]
ALDAFGSNDMASDRIKRPQGCRESAHSVRQRRYVEVDAFALVE